MLHSRLPRKGGLVDLRALQAMPKAKALAMVALLRPTDVFTSEQLGSQVLLSEAYQELDTEWRAVAAQFSVSDIEDAIVAKLAKLHAEAAASIGTPVIPRLKDSGFNAAVDELFATIPIDATTAEQLTAEQQNAIREGIAVGLHIFGLFVGGRTTEAVAVAQAYLQKLLDELEAAIEQFRSLKDEALAALDQPATLALFTLGDQRLEADGRDTIKRLKAIVIELFDGSDFGKKTAIIETMTTFMVFAHDLELRRGQATLRGGVHVKRALDANLRLERRFGLGFINPDGSLLDDRFATQADIKSLYSGLDPKSQKGLNHFLTHYTGERMFDLNRPNQTHAAIMEAIGGLRGYATLTTLLELGFFQRLTTDISDVCRKLTLAELNAMTADELKTAVNAISRTPHAGDAFLRARSATLGAAA